MVTADTEMEAVKGKQGVGALKNTFYLVNCVPAGMDARSPSSRMRDAGESVTAAGFFPHAVFMTKVPLLSLRHPLRSRVWQGQGKQALLASGRTQKPSLLGAG